MRTLAKIALTIMYLSLPLFVLGLSLEANGWIKTGQAIVTITAASVSVVVGIALVGMIYDTWNKDD